MNGYPFIPGESPPPPEPLARFLPPVPRGVVTQWLQSIVNTAEQGSWMLDPFGSSPRLAIEAASAGWRVLVAVNNPILRFLLEMYATSPERSAFQAALAELGAAMRGSERLEPHLRSFYTVTCRDCETLVEVDAFLWERDASAPYAYLANCSACGATGERPILPVDAHRAQTFAASGLHRARAIERVASANDPDRVYVEEALTVYPPRAIYSLFTLINKLDGLTIADEHRRALQALILTACDSANTLWAYPTERTRPKQLLTPPRFRENNVWKMLEEGIELWLANRNPVPIAFWPEDPGNQGGLCIFSGPLRELALQTTLGKPLPKFRALITAIPRPNQAFWTLSALWAGWLWGKEAVTHFKSVLRRRRYDWAWHYSALKSAFENLAVTIQTDIPMLLLISEAEAGYLAAAIAASSNAGFSLDEIALRGDQAQLHVRYNPSAVAHGMDIPATLIQSWKKFLRYYGQPAPFLNLWAAGLKGLENTGVFRVPPQESSEDSTLNTFNQLQNTLRNHLSYRSGFLRFGSSENIEASLFWVKEDAESEIHLGLPFSDRLEMAVVRALVRHRRIHIRDLEMEILPQFPGLLTPEKLWIQMILESYASPDPTDNSYWQLRPEDEPAKRRDDLLWMRQRLAELVGYYGYTQKGDFPLWWEDSAGAPRYWFYPIVSAIFTNIILAKSRLPASPPSQSIIILPGGRVNLALFKIRRDPRLSAMCQLQLPDSESAATEKTGWRFMKMRHLRWLLANPALLKQPLDELFELDPLTFSTPQMRLL